MKFVLKTFLVMAMGGLYLGSLQAESVITLTEPGSVGSRSPLDELAERYNSESGETRIRIQKMPSEELEEFLLKGTHFPGGDLVLIKGAGLGGSPILTQFFDPLESVVLERSVPEHLWHPDRLWVSFAKKYRHIYINKQKIEEAGLSIPQTFDDLGNPQWKNKLCLRHGDKEYNTSLVSYFLAQRGEKSTTRLLNRWMENEPVFVRGDLSGVLENIHAGSCLVGVANSYYLGYFLKNKNLTFSETPLRAVIPQRERSAHVNYISLGLLKGSLNKEKALEFLEWLVGANPQAMYSGLSYMFPVNSEAKNSIYYPGILDRAFGDDIIDDKQLNPVQVTREKDQILALMKRVGWKFKSEIPE